MKFKPSNYVALCLTLLLMGCDRPTPQAKTADSVESPTEHAQQPEKVEPAAEPAGEKPTESEPIEGEPAKSEAAEKPAAGILPMTREGIPGPDGLLYPDFRYAGVPGGIPDVPVVARLGDFGGLPDDGEDDFAAFAAGLEAVAQKGGGALVLEEGTYTLGRPLLINSHSTVIRGAGREKTRVVFEYLPERGTVDFLWPNPGVAELIGDDWVTAAAYPFGLTSLKLFVNGSPAFERGIAPEGTGEFTGGFLVSETKGLWKEGDNVVRVEAVWFDGTSAEAERTFTATPTQLGEAKNRRIQTNQPAIIKFVGDRWTHRGARWPLEADVKRGDTTIRLKTPIPAEPGDALLLTAAPDPGFIAEIESARPDIPRQQMFEVVAIEGDTLTLNQPARLDFPAAISHAELTYPIRSCGVEGFTLEQPKKLWMSGVVFENGWACWARNMGFEKIGRSPMGVGTKFGEARDIVIRGGWYRAGGGAGYFGNGEAWDCLSEDIDAEGLRHGPNMQWGASGNVVRNSRFNSSDAQYHMGWAVENLYENIVVDAKLGTGSYGHGLYAQHPETNVHGPGGGPRNVVYNCDFTAPYNGAYLGGSNFGWIIKYNRFVTEIGSGILIRKKQIDNVFDGNVLVVGNPGKAGLTLEEVRAENVRFGNNSVIGTETLVAGESTDGIEMSENRILPDTEENRRRPSPEVPSIFEWQRAHQFRMTTETPAE